MKHTLRVLLALTVFALAGLLGVATRTHAQTLTTGTVAGTVTDASGKRLSGVQIRIVDTDQTDVTNANGYFVITDVLPGTHTVEASLVGYQPVRATNVVVTQELTSTVNLTLTQRAETSLGTTTVVAPLIKKNVTPTLYTVTSKEEQLVRSQPNNLYQYPGALASQPGVVPDQDGYPTVRGSRQNEVGYMLDGILITENTSGQFATNLVTVGMDRMNVYTGGYRADLGASIGGLINAVVKTGASMRGQAAVEVNAGSWDYAGVVYEQGDVEKNGFNWYLSGNFWRTKYEENHQLSALPASEDIVAKFIQPLGKKDRVTALLTQGFERYELPINDPFTGQPWGFYPELSAGTQAIHTREWDNKTGTFVSTPATQDYSNQQYHIGSLTWSHQFSPATSLSLQGYAWNQHVDFNLLSPYNFQDQHVGSEKVAGKVDYATMLSQDLQVRVGGELMDSTNTLRIAADLTDYLGYPTGTGGIATIVQHRDKAPDTLDRNAYFSTTWKPSDRLTMDLGVRYDSRQYTREITPEEIALGRPSTQAADMEVFTRTGNKPTYSATTPRAGLTYSLSPRTLVKASAGRFVQFAPASYFERTYLPTPYDGDPVVIGGTTYLPAGSNWYAYRSRKVFDVGPEKVDSVDVGFEHQIGRYLGLAVTPFWRKTTDMFDYGQTYNEDGSAKAGGLEWANGAKGHTKGVETKLTMREKNGLSGWITYTYQQAKATTTASFPGAGSPDFSPEATEHRLDYDQKHTIYVVGQYRKGNFEINPMLELGSGYPWGGQPGDYFDEETGDYNYYYTYAPGSFAKIPILVNGEIQSLDVNSKNTGWHDNLSVTFRLYTDKQRSSYYFLQVQNILNSRDSTVKLWQDPNGLRPLGYVGEPVTYVDENGQTQTSENGYATYVPYTRIPPIFVLVGLRQTF